MPLASPVPTPPDTPFTSRERRLIEQLRTPLAVQRFLNTLPYNTAPKTLRTFRGVVRKQTAHCLEAVLTAAVVLEQHGFPPLALSFESTDFLDHVLFVYRTRGRWGSIGRSRDPGLHGRKAVFRTTRALALSYVEPYVDYTGRITGYAVVDLRNLGNYDWRLSERNAWKVERLLQDHPHRPIRSSEMKIDQWRTRYTQFAARFPAQKPLCFAGQQRWTELPTEFRRAVGRGATRRLGATVVQKKN